MYAASHMVDDMEGITSAMMLALSKHLLPVQTLCKQTAARPTQQIVAHLAEPVIAAGAAKGVQMCCALVQLQDAGAHSLHEDTVVGD